MTPKSEEKLAAMASESAMNVVLEAEAAARCAVQECASEAEAILRQAYQSAQQILALTDSRIARVRMRASEAVTDAIGRLENGTAGDSAQAVAPGIDAEFAETAAEEIAELLTSAGDGGG